MYVNVCVCVCVRVCVCVVKWVYMISVKFHLVFWHMWYKCPLSLLPLSFSLYLLKVNTESFVYYSDLNPLQWIGEESSFWSMYGNLYYFKVKWYCKHSLFSMSAQICVRERERERERERDECSLWLFQVNKQAVLRMLCKGKLWFQYTNENEHSKLKRYKSVKQGWHSSVKRTDWCWLESRQNFCFHHLLPHPHPLCPPPPFPSLKSLTKYSGYCGCPS